uniref:Zinc finger protein n=2 Tax=Wuchereria bancrofti TaxID=6293 RepID=A0A1I8E9L4_WUCBA
MPSRYCATLLITVKKHLLGEISLLRICQTAAMLFLIFWTSNRPVNLNNWKEIILIDMHFIYFFFFQLSNIQTTAAQTDQTEPLDLSISKVREKENGSQGLSVERENEEEIGLQVFQTKPLDLSAPKAKEEGDESQGLSVERENKKEVGLQVLQTKLLDLSAPKVKENEDSSQGLSVEGVSDERMKPQRQLVPIETLMEVMELSKQKRRTRKKQRCDICRKEVTNMKKHVMTHTGEKPYSCSICKKNFTQPWNVKEHVMTHSGVKPYSCPMCMKSFSRKRKLQTHMIIHGTNGPVYHCIVCNKDFRTKRSLKLHIHNH